MWAPLYSMLPNQISNEEKGHSLYSFFGDTISLAVMTHNPRTGMLFFLLRQKFLAAAIFSRLIFAVMKKKTKWQVRAQKIEPGCRTKKLVRKEGKRKYTRERTSPPCLRCSPMKRPNETSKRNCIPSRVLSGSQE